MTDRQAIESTYEDTCAVYRRVNAIDPDTQITRQTEQLISGNIPCALSKKSNTLQQDTTSTIRNVMTLFASPEVDIKAADKIVVHCQSGQIKTCIAADPFIYISHMEVELTQEGKA